MKKQVLFLIIPFLVLPIKSYSQNFQITQPKLEFNGTQLLISYDLTNTLKGDQFYVWVEIERKNGEQIKMKALSGDLGENIEAGMNKKIIWIPEKDSIFLNEEILVEVKAEKYIHSFNKGSMILISAVFPGLGQSKISRGKPWWLSGVASYGALAGGLIVHMNSLKTYNSYRDELSDISKRSDLFTKYEKQSGISNAMIISGTALWAANIIWVALIPNKYLPSQNVKLSLDQSSGPLKRTQLLTLRLTF